MNFFTPNNVRSVVRGRWLKSAASESALAGVGIDTRVDLANRIFIALKGANHDSHDHLDDAVRAGASLLVVSRPAEVGHLPRHVGVLQVDDGVRALTWMARAYRRTLTGVRVIAVTGTAGKTTTKRLIDAVLARHLPGTAAPRSFNNQIGVPLTVLGADPLDKYLVVEVGTNAPGEIAHLSEIAAPDIAVVTMIGRGHLEGFGSIEAVAREKAAVMQFLGEGGLVVAHADSPTLRPYLRPVTRRITFGESSEADLRLTDRGPDWLEVNERVRFRIGLPGKHNALNAMAAIVVGRRFGLDDEEISGALAEVRPDAMRLMRESIGGIDVHNDAYNANPESVIAALETFVELTPKAARRIVLLGDMLELGEQSEALHREIGRHVRDLDKRHGIDRVIAIGPLARFIADELIVAWPRERITCVQDAKSLLERDALADIVPGDAVLIKGSRGMALERIAMAIENRYASRPAVPNASV